MSIFDGKRLTNETFKLDIERMRRGWYSDKYFENINRMLTALSRENYNYSGNFPILPHGISPEQIAVGDMKWRCSGLPAEWGRPPWWAWINPWRC
jgi:nicotinate phosphoribosyltransferase